MGNEKGVMPPAVTMPQVSPAPPRPSVGSDEHFAALLRELPTLWDQKAAHVIANEVILRMLRASGFPKTVEAFAALEKWYS